MPKKPGVSYKGISKKGSSTDVFDIALCKRVRKILGLKRKELDNSVIRKVTTIHNKEVAKWIVENPEGYVMKNMGVIVVSKHLPREHNELKEETIEKIKDLKISDLLRKQLLKRYDVSIDSRVSFSQLMEYNRLIPQINLHTYFYIYKTMWFNHRNCKSKKAIAYTFSACTELNKMVFEKVMAGRDYYEWTFNSFYKHKVKPKW